MAKILLFGKSGSGKTALAQALSPLLGAPVFDGDAVRATYPCDLGYEQADRERNLRHIRSLCDAVTASGNDVIAATVAGTRDMRAEFAADFNVWVTGPEHLERKWAKNAIFEVPADGTIDLMTTHAHPPEYWADLIAGMVRPTFNPLYKTAMFVGRYQPFHDGHKAIIEEGIKRWGQVCIGVRDQNREWPFHYVAKRIDTKMRAHVGRYQIISLPNIVAICYGRDVGYEVVRIDMPEQVEEISGTEIRRITGHA